MEIIEETFHDNPRRPCTNYFLDILRIAFFLLIGKVINNHNNNIVVFDNSWSKLQIDILLFSGLHHI